MKLMIFLFSMMAAPAIAMNNSSLICKNPYAEASMFLIWRDVMWCDHYASHPGCQQLKTSLQAYTSSDLCDSPSDWMMENLCGKAKSELSINFQELIVHLIEDHKVNEDRAVAFAEGLIDIINKS